MSEFERELPSYRLVETHHGDDLQTVAYRELGDANRWAELVWINQLVHPYVTDDPASVRPGVLLNGSLIKVPSPAGFTEDKSSTEDVYETDLKVTNRALQDDGAGDFLTVSGIDNLNQQLSHAIDTPRGDLKRHPGYGCLVWQLFGTTNGPIAATLGAKYVKATLEADYRVERVTYSQAVANGDAVEVTAEAEALFGGSIQIRQSNV